MGSFAERSIGYLSTAEWIQLSEAKTRLASSSAAATARRKIGLFDSVDAEMGSDAPEELSVKPIEEVPPLKLT